MLTSRSSGCCATNRACMPRSRRTAGWRIGRRRPGAGHAGARTTAQRRRRGHRGLGRGFLAHAANQRAGAACARVRSARRTTIASCCGSSTGCCFSSLPKTATCSRPDADAQARERYERFYSLSRLRLLAEKRVGTRHADLYHGLRLVMAKLGSDARLPGTRSARARQLSIFTRGHCLTWKLRHCQSRSARRRARAGVHQRPARTAPGDYKNLRSEELGSVYEALLELHPDMHIEARQFDLKTVSGNERKTTGQLLHAESLVQCLLDSALEPVVAEAAEAARRGTGHPAPESVRPGVRQRPLPDCRGAPHGQAFSICAHRR